MSKAEELRRLLDERGVEYFKHEDGEPLRKLEKAEEPATSWHMGGASVCAVPIEGSDLFDLWIDHCTPEQAIAATLGTEINGETSDGYHTFNELYHHRAVLFSVIVENYRDAAWKAKRHHDGSMYDGMFIVGIDTPWGQASYHYNLDPYWDMFDCEERESAPEWDGHTPDDAIERIGKLATLGGNGYKQAAEYWQRMYYERLLAEENMLDMLRKLQGVTDESRYTEMFGTLERAARTCFNQGGGDLPRCSRCPAWRECKAGTMPKGSCIWETEDAMIEWLRGDV